MIFKSNKLNFPVSSQLCCVTVDITWNDTGGFVDSRILIMALKEISVICILTLKSNKPYSYLTSLLVVLCACVTMEMTWKGTEGFVDTRILLMV